MRVRFLRYINKANTVQVQTVRRNGPEWYTYSTPSAWLDALTLLAYQSPTLRNVLLTVCNNRVLTVKQPDQFPSSTRPKPGQTQHRQISRVENYFRIGLESYQNGAGSMSERFPN